MSKIKFDLNAWKEANELINEQLTEYLNKILSKLYKLESDENETGSYIGFRGRH